MALTKSLQTLTSNSSLTSVAACRDFYYYGNKLFQSDFIGIIQPGSSLIGQLQFNLLNSSVALVGYYAAAFTIDKPWMGRRRMQVAPFPNLTPGIAAKSVGRDLTSPS